jgi:predicted AlkP superfamily pyrophosphatase or phosphodiesterase
MPAPIIFLNAVGLTPRLLEHAPRLAAIAQNGWVRSVPEVVPAVTCTAQATILTGEPVQRHGIVANGWLFRDTNEVRFWQQSNRLLQAEPLYATARRRAQERGRRFKTAKLFWWFNQGAAVDVSVTPKPWYGIDGNKVFGITGTPPGYSDELESRLGLFPFSAFWGPTAGLPSTRWIAQCAAEVIRDHQPDLTFVYLPHLDYDPQRYGPSGCNMSKLVRQLDDLTAPLLDAAETLGAEVWIVSEYSHCDVTTPVLPNRALRQYGMIAVRHGPFGEHLDLYNSRAFAVCDHQLAHVYVADPADMPKIVDILKPLPGVSRVLVGEERSEYQLDHDRSGEIVLLSQPDCWFAYPFWFDDAVAPDYARTVAIHHKPGFDPCELFFDPRFSVPKLHAARRLLEKKLGFRTIFDVVPTDPTIVRGSHGLPAADPLDRPILIGHGPDPGPSVTMSGIKNLVLERLDLF